MQGPYNKNIKIENTRHSLRCRANGQICIAVEASFAIFHQCNKGNV